VLQVEDVFGVVEEGRSRQEGAELPHLVPEVCEVAMLDVKVVVLDEREHRSAERESFVEGLERLGREE
jgi:hypothetical protein